MSKPDALPPGLIYYPDTRPGIIRRRQGRGFSYFAPDGTRIADRVKRRALTALAIPPAYRDVWITPRDDGHLVATGFDAADRKQYRYHPDWQAHQALRKYDDLPRYGDALPTLRGWIGRHLRGPIGDRLTTIAAVLALLDRASLRVGNLEYRDENGTFGATTLRADHVSVETDTLLIEFIGKGDTDISESLHAPRLAEVLDGCADLPGAELMVWTDGTTLRHVRSEHVNETLGQICGDGITAKVIRTWNGTHAAFQEARKPGRLTISAMARAAADRLHNTPTIARNSYIHPVIIALSDMDPDDRLARIAREPSPDHPLLRSGERELHGYLRTSC